MEDLGVFQAVEYRNGIYQGFVDNSKPQGVGLFFDDDSGLYSSTWTQGVANGRTALFISQGKYFYGDWKNNMPHGFNIFRSGDTILLGNYNKGKLVGRFMIVFERQNFAVIVNGKQQINQTIEKMYYTTEEQLKSITNKHFESMFRPDDYFSFVFFIKHSFCLDGGPLKLEYIEGDLKFGYQRGLGVVFDDDNFIRKLGYLDENQRTAGLAASFGISNEEGNFETGNVIRYATGNKPAEKIRKLFRGEHKKSIFYKNDFVLLDTESLSKYLEETLKKLIFKIAELPLTDRSGNETLRELNDSLEYQPRKKTIDQGEKIIKMKFQIQNSIGKRNGSEISSPFVKQERGIGEYRKLYYTPIESHEYIEPEGIKFNKPSSNAPYLERQLFIERNHLADYRSKYEVPNKISLREEAEKGFFEKEEFPNRESQKSKRTSRIQESKREMEAEILRREQEKRELEAEIHRKEHEKRMSEAKKQEEELLRERQKQQELHEEIQKQIERQKQKQRELERQKTINKSIEKQINKLPEFTHLELKPSASKVTFKNPPEESGLNRNHTEPKHPQNVRTVDFPVQTSFSEKDDSLNISNEAYFKKQPSAEKSTAIKSPPPPEIHYNPFLRTFVSNKYPPLNENVEEPFHKVETVPNLNEYNPSKKDEEGEDSLEKMKKLKLTEFKLPRYLIKEDESMEEDPEPINRKLFHPYKDSPPSMTSKRITNTTYTEGKKNPKVNEERERTPGKSYLQIYKTSTTEEKPKNKSPQPKGLSPNPIKRVINSPYTKGKSRQQTSKKVIEIEHERTSPEGKKTTTYERIIKKYHYVSEKA